MRVLFSPTVSGYSVQHQSLKRLLSSSSYSEPLLMSSNATKWHEMLGEDSGFRRRRDLHRGPFHFYDLDDPRTHDTRFLPNPDYNSQGTDEFDWDYIKSLESLADQRHVSDESSRWWSELPGRVWNSATSLPYMETLQSLSPYAKWAYFGFKTLSPYLLKLIPDRKEVTHIYPTRRPEYHRYAPRYRSYKRRKYRR